MTSTLRPTSDPDGPPGMDPTEWALRCDLAAAYQLVDLFGMTDLAANHISVRLPGQERFLLNPFGLLYDEITASSLITVDVDGKVLDGDADQLNPAGFVIHSAVHRARPELACVLHTHTRAVIGVGAMADGLLPITQKALAVRAFLRYHDYEGGALDLDERERIAADLADGRVMILRNHGALAVGRTIPETWLWNHRLEWACRYQIDALVGMAAGFPLQELSEETIARSTAQARDALADGSTFMRVPETWASLLRRLERERGPSYRT